MPALAAHPCQQVCAWVPTAEFRTTESPATELRDQLRVFQCTGCRSEWTADQVWRPADQRGQVPVSVLLELSRRDAVSQKHASEHLRSEPQ
jgi:hypothetical protein